MAGQANVSEMAAKRVLSDDFQAENSSQLTVRSPSLKELDLEGTRTAQPTETVADRVLRLAGEVAGIGEVGRGTAASPPTGLSPLAQRNR